MYDKPDTQRMSSIFDITANGVEGRGTEMIRRESPAGVWFLREPARAGRSATVGIVAEQGIVDQGRAILS